jgi:hypothetical protein
MIVLLIGDYRPLDAIGRRMHDAWLDTLQCWFTRQFYHRPYAKREQEHSKGHDDVLVHSSLSKRCDTRK